MSRILLALLLAVPLFSQKRSKHVAPQALAQHVSFLSSDALEGRRSPSKGLDAAAAYIASWFRRFGLEAPIDGGYFQVARPTIRPQSMGGFKLILEQASTRVPIVPTQISGWVGAAVYGNAGAYGHSLSERVESVSFFDGDTIRKLNKAECEFRYRESIFKRRKDWIIFSVDLVLDAGHKSELVEISAEIRKVRDEKFPPTMKCAGSIFKNFLLRDLPANIAAVVPATVVREGKIPAAWFLEQAGAKGTVSGGIRVADYHANLIYNTGTGTSAELCQMIEHLKQLVREKFGLKLEEEVQYVGFAA